MSANSGATRPRVAQVARASITGTESMSRNEFIHAVIAGLIGRQGRKPRSPMIADVIIAAAASGVTLQMSEDVHRQKSFIRKQGLVIIAQALLFKDRFRIAEDVFFRPFKLGVMAAIEAGTTLSDDLKTELMSKTVEYFFEPPQYLNDPYQFTRNYSVIALGNSGEPSMQEPVFTALLRALDYARAWPMPAGSAHSAAQVLVQLLT